MPSSWTSERCPAGYAVWRPAKFLRRLGGKTFAPGRGALNSPVSARARSSACDSISVMKRTKKVDAEFVEPSQHQIEARKAWDHARMDLQLLIKGFGAVLTSMWCEDHEVEVLLDSGGGKIREQLLVVSMARK